jgi:DNA-binding CsgD family transcriptional regulator/N-acetylneuraminic acid mutarotase
MPLNEEFDLSEREQEILKLLATGASNKEIAQRLFISPNTVKVHVRNIFNKIGVVSRTEAALYALRKGLIDQAVTEAQLSAEEDTTVQPEITLQPEGALQPESASQLEMVIQAAQGRRSIVWIALGLMLMLIVTVLGWWWRDRGLATTVLPTLTPTSAVLRRWQVQENLPRVLSAPAAVVYEQAFYFVAGEQDGSTWLYRPKQREWQELALKPTPVRDAGAVLIGELIYVPGGRLADGQPSERLEVYDPRTDRWEERAALPAPRCAYALAALEGRLYLFGGWDGHGYTADVFIYDPQTDVWNIGQPMGAGRGFAAAVSTGGKILVLGGWDGKQALSTNSVYFPQRDEKGENAWEEQHPLPQGRYGLSAAFLTDVVYVMGGTDGKQELAPLMFDVEMGAWKPLELPPQGLGVQPVVLPLGTQLHILGGLHEGVGTIEHLTYQASYVIVLPVLQNGGQ